MFSKARTPAVKVRSKAFEAGKDAVDALVLGGLMHHAERLSREVIALTSFRLHLAELQKAIPGNPMNYHEAVKAAIQETNEVLGNYNANNKPMIMRGGVGRVVTMYKFFPLLTTKLLVVNFFKMLPGLNKQGKVAAATKFFGVYLVTPYVSTMSRTAKRSWGVSPLANSILGARKRLVPFGIFSITPY